MNWLVWLDGLGWAGCGLYSGCVWLGLSWIGCGLYGWKADEYDVWMGVKCVLGRGSVGMGLTMGAGWGWFRRGGFWKVGWVC